VGFAATLAEALRDVPRAFLCALLVPFAPELRREGAADLLAKDFLLIGFLLDDFLPATFFLAFTALRAIANLRLLKTA
jgi:hypothetical protein